MTNQSKLRPLSPLQAMTQRVPNVEPSSLNAETKKDTNKSKEELSAKFDSLDINDSIVLLEPKQISNWVHHDRPASELGNIDEFALELKNNGQLQPCIVRPLKNDTKFRFELIVGERRWRAAQKANIKLKVIIQNLTDHEAAIAQANENSQRKDLSDYAKGISYAKLINDKILNQKDLISSLKISQSDVSRLLSFSKVPKIIWDTIEDKSKISARTAAEIRSLSNKGSQYIDAILKVASDIETGKLGEKLLKRKIENILSAKRTGVSDFKEVKTANGRHIFTWRRDSNNHISISFPKDVRSIIDRNEVENILKQTIEKQLNYLNERSTS